MSNYLAIATATAALCQILDPIKTDVPGAEVTTGRPGSTDGGAPVTGVNVFLYRAVHNTAWRNNDLPTRHPGGELAQCPRVAVDLDYLLSFYGDEKTLEPQRLLGSVLRLLHSRPVIARRQIQDTISSQTFLADSNLASEVEQLRISPSTLSLEEMAKLWSMLQSPYALSLSYQVSVLFIDGEENPPPPALPVQERKIKIGPNNL